MKVYVFRFQIVWKTYDVTRVPRLAVKPISGTVHPVEPGRNAIVDGAANLYDVPAVIVLIEKVILRKESFKPPLIVCFNIIAIIG